MASSKFSCLLALVLLSSCLPFCQATYHPTKPEECLAALWNVYGKLLFEGFGSGSYYVSLCRNPLAVASVYASSRVYCRADEVEAGITYANELCIQYAKHPMLSESAVAANLTDEVTCNMSVIGLDDLTSKENYTTPVLLSKELFDVTYHTEDDWDYEHRNARETYCYIIYGFWACILLIGILHRLVFHTTESRQVPISINVEDNGMPDSRKATPGVRGHGLLRIASSCVQKYMITPSLLPPYRRQLLFGCTIPTRIEAVVIYGFWALNVVLCTVSYRGFEGNLYYSKVSVQVCRYIADRTGILAYALLPILWMFSGRNNIFIWATGWRFSTFTLFHRHVARIATLQAIVHGFAFTAFYKLNERWSTYKKDLRKAWFSLGIMGVIAISFLILSSFSIFRRKTYESFLLIHISLSVVLLVCLFQHTSIFDGEFSPYLWPPVAIWIFDRFLRISRLLYCNIHVHLQKGRQLYRTKATVSYDHDADMLFVTAVTGTTRLKPGPGQHYYLYQPFRLAGWESHPFTLATWDLRVSEDSAEASDSTVASSTELFSSPKSRHNELALSFWIKPCDGWTRQLRNQYTASGSTTISPTILVEGPYGMQEPLWTFDKVLLIAGGSGIAAIAPYLVDYMRRSKQQQKTRTRFINVVWVSSNEDFIRKQAATWPLEDALARDDVHATFYCTTIRTSALASSTATSSLELQTPKETEVIAGLFVTERRQRPSALEAVAIVQSRPDIGSIMQKAANSAHKTKSRLAIFLCGPPGLADAGRDAAYRAMEANDDSVRYFEEAYGW